MLRIACLSGLLFAIALASHVQPAFAQAKPAAVRTKPGFFGRVKSVLRPRNPFARRRSQEPQSTFGRAKAKSDLHNARQMENQIHRDDAQGNNALHETRPYEPPGKRRFTELPNRATESDDDSASDSEPVTDSDSRPRNDLNFPSISDGTDRMLNQTYAMENSATNILSRSSAMSHKDNSFKDLKSARREMARTAGHKPTASRENREASRAQSKTESTRTLQSRNNSALGKESFSPESRPAPSRRTAITPRVIDFNRFGGRSRTRTSVQSFGRSTGSGARIITFGPSTSRSRTSLK